MEFGWGVGLGEKVGLSIEGPHARGAPKDAQINSGFGKGPMENAYVQGPEYGWGY